MVTSAVDLGNASMRASKIDGDYTPKMSTTKDSLEDDTIRQAVLKAALKRHQDSIKY